MDRIWLDGLVQQHGPNTIIERIRPYLTDARCQRIDTVLAARMGDIGVAVESPTDPHNAAAIVRTADAFGVMHVHVIAAEGRALHSKGTTQGAHRWVDTHHHPDLDSFLADVRERDALVCGAWMDAPHTVDEIPADRHVCLLLGNESRGLSQRAREASRLGYRVEMFGMSESLNLSVTAALSLYNVLQRRRAIVGRGDLDQDTLCQLRARYYLASVDRRLTEGLFGAGEGTA